MHLKGPFHADKKHVFEALLRAEEALVFKIVADLGRKPAHRKVQTRTQRRQRLIHALAKPPRDAALDVEAEMRGDAAMITADKRQQLLFAVGVEIPGPGLGEIEIQRRRFVRAKRERLK